MSWLQRLNETYEACFGMPQFEAKPLAPVDHVEQQAHIEISLDAQGCFLRASVVSKEPTLIPATEKSAGRTYNKVAHPLCDKLRYVADLPDDSGEHETYLKQLRSWAATSDSAKLKAILRYVEKRSIVADLLEAGVLTAVQDGTLETKWQNGLSALAKLLTADSKTKERDQGDALIRWRVEIPGIMEDSVWKDAALQREWASFNAASGDKRGLCLHTGMEEPLAFNHPRRLRHGGDGAKLISANDSPFDSKGKPRQHGFTFAGRFLRMEEAYGLGSASTQRAHNALRWLIDRQGMKHGDQVVVAWATGGEHIPRPVVNTLELLSSDDDEDVLAAQDAQAPEAKTQQRYTGDAGEAFAKRLNRRMQGYRSHLTDRNHVVVMALDSATPGRMAILYYRELRGSEFLERIERWHSALAWPQDFGKDLRFTGAPSPRDIAEAAYGRRVDEKLRKATVERLLPCILDGRPLPRDLEQSVVRRATNRAGLERWEFERTLGIACSLVRATHPQENYSMNLDESRTTRDYLYGRLLAVADDIEAYALFLSRQSRDTSASRLMQRFADHPFQTWRTIRLQLQPYLSQLRASRPGSYNASNELLDRITSSFQTGESGASDMESNKRLSGEFLLGFHSQREALRAKRTKNPVTGEPGSTQEGEE